MVGHPGRHQQPVGGRRAGFAVVALCLAVASLAVLWGMTGFNRLGDLAEPESVAAASGDSAKGPDAEPGRGDGGVRAAEGSHTTQGGFLDELARGGTDTALAKDAVVAKVSWSDDCPLPEAAADVLRAYREVPTARLALSGYLDIKGDVWGAIVRDGRGWVDLVIVAADEGDASCRLRAQRLVPPSGAVEEGS